MTDELAEVKEQVKELKAELDALKERLDRLVQQFKQHDHRSASDRFNAGNE